MGFAAFPHWCNTKNYIHTGDLESIKYSELGLKHMYHLTYIYIYYVYIGCQGGNEICQSAAAGQETYVAHSYLIFEGKRQIDSQQVLKNANHGYRCRGFYRTLNCGPPKAKNSSATRLQRTFHLQNKPSTFKYTAIIR